MPQSRADAKSHKGIGKGSMQQYILSRLHGCMWVLETQMTKKLASMTRGDEKYHVKIGSHVIGLINLLQQYYPIWSKGCGELKQYCMD